MNRLLERACLMAMRAETAMNRTTNPRMMSSCPRSRRGFFLWGAMRSSVMVEAEVRTRLDKVDMDADSTSTMTMPMITAGREESIRGTTASNPSARTSMS